MAAAVTMMFVGAIANASAFIGGSVLARTLGSKHIDQEKIRHDKALESYQVAMGDFQKKREQYQDWLNNEYTKKKQADDNMGHTDIAFKLYSRAHPESHHALSKKPDFGDFYKPSGNQKKYEMAYVGGSVVVAGALASRFL